MNDGFINEHELRDYINSKNYKEYNQNIKNFLYFVFNGNIDINLAFIANKIIGQVKPDLSISHNGTTKNLFS